MAHILISTPETFDAIARNNADLFHGTGGDALPSILKDGLCSAEELSKRHKEITTGELIGRDLKLHKPSKNIFSIFGGKKYKDVKLRNFISLTDDAGTAGMYANNYGRGFGIVIGYSSDQLKELDAGKFYRVYSTLTEAGFTGNIPADSIKVIAAPRDKIEYVRKLVGDKPIEVVPLELDDVFYRCNEQYRDEGTSPVYIYREKTQEFIAKQYITNVETSGKNFVNTATGLDRVKMLKERIRSLTSDGTADLTQLTHGEFQARLQEMDRQICKEILMEDVEEYIMTIREYQGDLEILPNGMDRIRLLRERVDILIESGSIDVTQVTGSEFRNIIKAEDVKIVKELSDGKIETTIGMPQIEMVEAPNGVSIVDALQKEEPRLETTDVPQLEVVEASKVAIADMPETRSPFEEMSPRQETELQNPYEAELRSQIQELEEKISGSNMENDEMGSSFLEIKKIISGIYEELQEKGINEIGLRDSIEELGNSVGTAEWELYQDRADFLREIQRIKEEFEKNIYTNEDEKTILLRIQESANTRNDYAVKKYKELKDKLEECIQKNNYLRRNSNEYDEVGTTLNQGLRKINDNIEELEGLEKKRYESIDENIAQMESTLRRKAFDDGGQSLKSHKQELTNAEVEDIVSEYIRAIETSGRNIKKYDFNRTRMLEERIKSQISDGTIELTQLTREEFQTRLQEVDRQICIEILSQDVDDYLKGCKEAQKGIKTFEGESDRGQLLKERINSQIEDGTIDITQISRKDFQEAIMDIDAQICGELFEAEGQIFAACYKFKYYMAALNRVKSRVDDIFIKYKDDTFGVDQGLVKNMSPERLDELAGIMSERYSIPHDMATVLISTMDSKRSGGICPYAAFINATFIEFADIPEVFAETTGLNLFKTVNGKKVGNYDELLVDMFVAINAEKLLDKTVDPVTGNIEYRFIDNKRRSDFSGTYMFTGKSKLDTSKISMWFLKKYLHMVEKLPDIDKSKLDYLEIKKKEDITVNAENLRETVSKIQEAIDERKLVTYSATKKGIKDSTQPNGYREVPMTVHFYGEDGFTYPIEGGHIVFVTGYNEFGLTVDSYGVRGVIPYDDIIDDTHWSNIEIIEFKGHSNTPKFGSQVTTQVGISEV